MPRPEKPAFLFFRRAGARVEELEAAYERLLVTGGEDPVVLKRATSSVREDLAAAREELSRAEAVAPSPSGPSGERCSRR